MKTALSAAKLPSLPSYGERLAYITKDPAVKGLVLEALGRHDVTLKRHIKGTTEPKASEVVKIAEVTGLSADWLLRGLSSPEGAQENDSSVVWVPRLDVQASAGRGRIALPDERHGSSLIGFQEDWLRSLGVLPQHAEFVVATGDSMEPTVRDGDLLLVNRAARELINGAIYVLVFNDVVMVKRLHQMFTGAVRVISDNPRYPEEVVGRADIESFRIEGRIRWYGRAL